MLHNFAAVLGRVGNGQIPELWMVEAKSGSSAEFSRPDGFGRTVLPPSVRPWRLGQRVRTPHVGPARRWGFRSAAPRVAVWTPPVRAGARARGNLDRLRAGGARGGLEPRGAGAAPGPDARGCAACVGGAHAVAAAADGARLGDRRGRGGGRPGR